MRVERLLRWLAPRKANELRCQCAVVTGASTYKPRLSHARHLVEPAKYAPSPKSLFVFFSTKFYAQVLLLWYNAFINL